MKLVVPYSEQLPAADVALLRLAGLLGAQSEVLDLGSEDCLSWQLIQTRVKDRHCCFVINAQAIWDWLRSDSLPQDFVSYLTANFEFVLIHNLLPSPLASSVIQAFSNGALESLRPVENSGADYEFSLDCPDVCGPFSGLKCGPVDTANDQVFIRKENAGAGLIRTLIEIDGQPFVASVQHQQARVFFLGSAATADIDSQGGESSVRKCFSQFVPAAMLLRNMFDEECWHPVEQHATFIVDDPFLRKTYGFLRYDRLEALMDEYNFHTCIAFIPYNYSRNSRRITQMFRDRPDRFSICFHGNDHTGAEFASRDADLLNSMTTVAEKRIEVLRNTSGIQCDPVMVFPQGNFSVEAMDVLKAHNFVSVVNTVRHPLGHSDNITLGEFIEPAILRYSQFPLFLRKYVKEITIQDVAFNLFFGKPVLLVEHHEIFKDPECLTQLVSAINKLAPGILWSSLRTTVEKSYLTRTAAKDRLQIRAYSNAVNVENPSDSPISCHVEWPGRVGIDHTQVFANGSPTLSSSDGKSIYASCDLPAQSLTTFSLVHRNDFGLSSANQSLKWVGKVFLRRRLSEIRDNYFSKSDLVMSTMNRLRRSFRKNDD